MKRKFLIYTLFIMGYALLLHSGCQEQVKSEFAVDSDKPSPRITFENPVYDFGEVGPNRKNTGWIKFTNTGEALLKITKVDQCCGIVTRLDKMEYEPGESGALELEWNSGPRPSTMYRKLTLHANDPKKPQTTLSLTAKVVLQVDWEPKSLKLFLDKENAGCPNIIIKSLDKQPFSILQFKSTADCITAGYDSSVEATKFILRPKVNVNAMPKNLKGRINVNLTHPEGKNATIFFSVLPEYTISPSLIIVWDAEPGKPTTKTIKVLCNYNKDFEIESITAKRNIIKVKVLEQKKIANGYRLEVELTPPILENKINFADEFSINIKGGKELIISCKGYYSKKKSRPGMQ
jgi:hypothetical protein